MSVIQHKTPSGAVLAFHALTHSSNWSTSSGIYAFCTAKPSGNYDVHYVGQTNSFKDRIPNHERWLEAMRLGATHILAAIVPTQAERDRIEAELITQWKPRLNKQGV